MYSLNLLLILSFQITCIIREIITGTPRAFWEDGAIMSLIFFFCITILVSIYNDWTHVNIILLNTMVVCTLITMMHVLWYYKWSPPPPDVSAVWFGGVTDWYQSIVYSELSISIHKRYTNYKYIGAKSSDYKYTFKNFKYFYKKYTNPHPYKYIVIRT